MDLKSFFDQMLTPGTRACTIFGAAVGLVFALLWLTLGFWRTLIVAVFCLVGAFVGGVKDKKRFIEGVRSFFHRDDNTTYYD